MNFIEVIVTDWDIVLMNVVDKVFPKSLDILCRFHISMNVKRKFQNETLNKVFTIDELKFVFYNLCHKVIMEYNITWERTRVKMVIIFYLVFCSRRKSEYIFIILSYLYNGYNL
jgi:hypothetical protein